MIRNLRIHVREISARHDPFLSGYKRNELFWIEIPVGQQIPYF